MDVAVTTGEVSEGNELQAQMDRAEANTDTPVTTVTADAGYTHATNYAAMETRGVEAATMNLKKLRPRRGPFGLCGLCGESSVRRKSQKRTEASHAAARQPAPLRRGGAHPAPGMVVSRRARVGPDPGRGL